VGLILAHEYENDVDYYYYYYYYVCVLPYKLHYQIILMGMRDIVVWKRQGCDRVFLACTLAAGTATTTGESLLLAVNVKFGAGIQNCS